MSIDVETLYSEAHLGLAGAHRAFLLFNKVSGAYVSWMNYHEPDGIDRTLFDVAVVDAYNHQKQLVTGRFPNFQIVTIAELPQEVSESFIDRMTAEEINARYSTSRQLNTLSAAVVAIAEKLGMAEDPAVLPLVDQVLTIADLVRVGNLRKQGYQEDDSFTYVSKASVLDEYHAIHEGGLGEAIGPREIRTGD